MSSTAANAASEFPNPEAGAIVEPKEAAAAAGLRYVHDDRPGITRHAVGKSFAYRAPDGTKVRDAAALARIRALAIPPAYTDVWICPHADGHIQATGRDAKGRKQYRYHARWHEVREQTKYERLVEFAAVLPAIRARVAQDLGRKGLVREKVLATVVRLLETTLIRVGNDEYASSNGSYGLTTLENGHADVEGKRVAFRFRGKSGKDWEVDVKDARVAKVVRECQDLPGQELFAYEDDDGAVHDVGSADVNAYLREISGTDITAKDFRTWSGTVMAALALREFEAVDTAAIAKKNVRAAIENVAARLGNTPTVCRKAYVHPDILEGYLGGKLVLEITEQAEQELRDELPRLKPEEAAVLALLARLKQDRVPEVPKAKRRKAASPRTATAKRARTARRAAA